MRLRVLSVTMFLLASCHAPRPETARHMDGRVSHEAAKLSADLATFAEKTAVVRGLATAVLVGHDGERRTEVALVVKRPDKLRIEAMDALADVWAVAATDGRTLWLHIPKRQRVYRGKATERNLNRLADFGWEIRELAAVVAGNVPFGEGAEFLEMSGERHRHFRLRDKPLHLFVDRHRRPMRVVRFADEDGDRVNPERSRRIDYEITYANYRLVKGISFPFEINATFPGRGARIAIRYRDVNLGGDVDPQIFTWKAPSLMKTVELR